MFIKPTAVLIHVADGLAWYKKAFPNAIAEYLPEFDFTLLHVGNFTIEIVQEDAKVSEGKKGSVLYCQFIGITKVIAHLLQLGAPLHLGPMEIDQGLKMCQVEDPSDNLIGLKGK